MCLFDFPLFCVRIVILDVGYRLRIILNDANPNASGIFDAKTTILDITNDGTGFDVSGLANIKV